MKELKDTGETFEGKRRESEETRIVIRTFCSVEKRGLTKRVDT